VVEGEEDKVCLLKKAIYGLKQSSQNWNGKAHKVLVELGYKQSCHESCLYFKLGDDSGVIIALYVDDFLFYNDKSEAKRLKKELLCHFHMKDLGSVNQCLGMEIECDRVNHRIKISQTQYFVDVLDRFGMVGCKPVGTPMDVNNHFVNDENVNNVPYQQVIGCLMYLSVCTRPDIAFVSSYLSQFNLNHTAEHWLAVKHGIRYLKGTKEMSLVYQKSSDGLVGYTDADWANDATDHKSFTGYVLKFANSAVSWESHKQSTIALSSTQAEYMALGDACKEAIHLKGVMSELFGNVGPITILNDSQSAQSIATNSVHHRRTKHIYVRFHAIREMVEERKVKLVYIPEAKMVADALTNALLGPKHKFCVTGLGVKC
jgi:hypothetical protein